MFKVSALSRNQPTRVAPFYGSARDQKTVFSKKITPAFTLSDKKRHAVHNHLLECRFFFDFFDFLPDFVEAVCLRFGCDGLLSLSLIEEDDSLCFKADFILLVAFLPCDITTTEGWTSNFEVGFTSCFGWVDDSDLVVVRLITPILKIGGKTELVSPSPG